VDSNSIIEKNNRKSNKQLLMQSHLRGYFTPGITASGVADGSGGEASITGTGAAETEIEVAVLRI
jgi:hypothetical protein